MEHQFGPWEWFDEEDGLQWRHCQVKHNGQECTKAEFRQVSPPSKDDLND